MQHSQASRCLQSFSKDIVFVEAQGRGIITIMSCNAGARAGAILVETLCDGGFAIGNSW